METQNVTPVAKATIATQLFDAPGIGALIVCVIFIIFGIVSLFKGDTGQGLTLIIAPLVVYAIVMGYLVFVQKESINKRKKYQDYLATLKTGDK
jgi:hypothetical protein